MPCTMRQCYLTTHTLVPCPKDIPKQPPHLLHYENKTQTTEQPSCYSRPLNQNPNVLPQESGVGPAQSLSSCLWLSMCLSIPVPPRNAAFNHMVEEWQPSNGQSGGRSLLGCLSASRTLASGGQATQWGFLEWPSRNTAPDVAMMSF